MKKIYIFLLVSFVFSCTQKKTYTNLSPNDVKLIVNTITKHTQVNPNIDTIFINKKYDYSNYMVFCKWLGPGVEIQLDYTKNDAVLNTYCFIEYAQQNKNIIEPINLVLNVR